ncbi:RNA polymerase sigma factor SigJ [Yinghuangia seranimata]|uniref:RNA polymerase sigma factor SigJ n=1 Tax=Yinghuangia seranimata TaxID=408067 RepID=UPI00248CF17A|nr:RNA polymerase sigma factor SigJ [Yinghuangia seranimata]MDI2126555.1 RNA polymerase sigma factor SigJ [Yinghuangia seranimata]
MDTTTGTAAAQAELWLAERFEGLRPHLRTVAYSMLGSRAEAEDAVQEAWLRVSRTGPDGIEDLRAWLTTVVGRISLDMLRSRRSRREDYPGTWLPEPIVQGAEPDDDPERLAIQVDAVGLALMVVLETLGPAERLAFVLHDVFGLPFDEIALVVDRTPAATRQLASRARRRVRTAPQPDRDVVRQRAVVDAFLAAAREGNFDALLATLHPDVTFTLDLGRLSPAGFPALHGAEDVARHMLTTAPTFLPLARRATINGGPGVAADSAGGVAGFTVVDDLIVRIDVIADPEKLHGSLH